jgi:hypothetical protein
MCRPVAQVAELVDALVSGTSGASREGSSPFLGTICSRKWFQILNFYDNIGGGSAGRFAM